MTDVILETPNLRLFLQTPEQVRVWIDGLPPEVKAQLSADWVARVHATTTPDPWAHGLSIVHRVTGTAVGSCAFKGPPTSDGVVEIAYGIDPDHQRNGYATEAATALVAFAFASGQVRLVIAHTLPEANASARVLTKCGFRHVGEVVDPDDGLVWRWERYPDPPA